MENLQNQTLVVHVDTAKPVYANVDTFGLVHLTDDLNELPPAGRGKNWISINICLSNDPQINRPSGFYSLNSVLHPWLDNSPIDPELGFEVVGKDDLAYLKCILVLGLQIAERMIDQGHLCENRCFSFDVEFDKYNSAFYRNVYQESFADDFGKIPDSQKVTL